MKLGLLLRRGAGEGEGGGGVGLSVHLTEHHVHGTDDGDDVSEHVVPADVVHEGQVQEPGGLGGAVESDHNNKI